MDNIIYERDYTEEPLPEDPAFQLMYERTKDLLHRFNRRVLAVPRVMDPLRRGEYDRLLHLCDAFAKKYAGKITGLIDYRKYDATICVTLPYFEFDEPEDFPLLCSLRCADSVTFQPCKSGGTELVLFFNCFIPLHTSKEALIQEILNEDPDLRELFTPDSFPPDTP